jgi:hypothetical protein
MPNDEIGAHDTAPPPNRRATVLAAAGNPLAAAHARRVAATIREPSRPSMAVPEQEYNPASPGGTLLREEVVSRPRRDTDAVRPAMASAPVETLDVEVFDPAFEAHRMRLTGAAWSDIAAATGYSSGAVCQLAVTAFLQKAAVTRTPEQQRAAVQTELDRLDELQRTCWLAATNGDVKAGHLVLKIIVERVKLLGLDRQPADAREQ